MQIYFQYPAGGKEPKAGDDGIDFCFKGGRGFTMGGKILSPSAAPPFPPLSPVFGILGHSAI